MTTRRIIACLDVKDGKVVKGVRFLDLKLKGDPAELASRYEEEGADEIVFLDISATVEGRKTLLEKVRETASVLSIPLTVGGGVRTVEDVSNLLSNGADKVSLNTVAAENPSVVSMASREFGAQAVVVAIDAKRVGNGWRVFVRSGTKDTGLDAVDWAKRVEEMGAGEILLTSIDRDGTRDGYDLELTKAVVRATKVPVIASGGAGKPDHFLSVFRQAGADAALAAGIFHDGVIRIRELKDYLKDAGIEVRT
ncbi:MULTISPECIES: imidazole glycerol phosphate synthase subunit HisF [Metallosphaera]|uniref:Imidazole glycerol phosphate synthase subunit HisF n=3 Tax=Metallosphaera TaxID=41980 RepID=HIS6_METS5|nr:MULTISPECIES: imidazole glycerol phosphate synthase subunit HisF [Metallosphaera]A4YI34.1 RecName: Full=Imidazole glycerol phosphate synthase subunit HisF; AltName: Full=IGP synthase cyclase subunit; AltName: Full=IGP synthase subunit HisF; AltName: Full=ImGP synthase subunit HisF; Short=IGPS subunit HisF [Metallosphaera sedula DSM 5348]ABP96086.1 imidazole glycerol phosphate synthase subunit hisF [Metallosphaera sedula DSM 5348]AIM28070.1 imidazole glycerol phosphate synthase subunit hisF [M